MKERKPVTCTLGHDVVAGTIFCWQCKPNERPIGELSADHGQLLWSTTARVLAKRETALLVYLAGKPMVAVEVFEPATNARPPYVRMRVREPAQPDSAAVEARVALREVLRSLVTGRERVEAHAE